MGEDKLFEISADTVTIEVKDSRTGQTFRRELPIDYYENANLLRLRGEHLDGSVSDIVFYSGRGIERAKDISGKGIDHDNCGSHK